MTTLRVPPDKLVKPNVAIVGFTDHRRHAFELDREQWEIWGINELHRYEEVAKFDRWFEVHARKDLAHDPEHLKAMATFDIPVYMHQHWSDIPASVPFPVQDVVRFTATEYYTNSPAWMIGFARLLGAKKIALYGIDLAQDTEYAKERPCVEFHIGLARGSGVDVYVPDTSDLLKCVGMYGFGEQGTFFARKLAERLQWLHEQDNHWLGQLRNLEAEYRQKKKALQREYHTKREQLLANRFQMAGAISNTEYFRRSFAVTGEGKEGQPTPDRSQDPRTGITPAQVAASVPAADSANRIAEHVRS